MPFGMSGKEWKSFLNGGTPTVDLIGIGTRPAKEAQALKPGDFIMFNYGYTGEVREVKPVGDASVEVCYLSNGCGKECIWKKRKTTLVALADGDSGRRF